MDGSQPGRELLVQVLSQPYDRGASFFFQAEAGIRDHCVTGVQTCALPISAAPLIARPLNVAAPLASVVAVALLSVAPAGPEAITAVTGTPAPPAGLPAASRTWSTGCCPKAAPLVAVGEGSAVIVSCVAAPASTLVMQGVRVESPADSTRSVSSPAAPLIANPQHGAVPLSPTRRSSDLSVAPAGPEAITAVTGTPAPPTGLPAASRTWSTGCWLNGAPLVAVDEGGVVIVNCVAVPAPSVMVPEVAGVRSEERRVGKGGRSGGAAQPWTARQ